MRTSVKTTRFGEIEVSTSDIITIVDGLLGHPELTKFVVVSSNNTDELCWLQSTEADDFAIVVGEHSTFEQDYTVTIDAATADMIGLSNPDDVRILLQCDSSGILTKYKPDYPIVYNTANNKAIQVRR